MKKDSPDSKPSVPRGEWNNEDRKEATCGYREAAEGEYEKHNPKPFCRSEADPLFFRPRHYMVV